MTVTVLFLVAKDKVKEGRRFLSVMRNEKEMAVTVSLETCRPSLKEPCWPLIQYF